MGVKCSEIIRFIEKFAPPNLAEDWDNVGLILGNYAQDIKSIMICLDVTGKVMEEAVEKKVDLIISHHPLIYKGIKYINSGDYKGEIIYGLIKNGISVYCAHTNLDAAKGGVNECLAEVLGLKDIRSISAGRSSKMYKLAAYDVYPLEQTVDEQGITIVGTLEIPQKMECFISTVKKKLDIENMRKIGDLDRDIVKVGVFCGSLEEKYLNCFQKEGVDILVTGDIKYHMAMDMLSMDMCILDAGHFNTEKIIIPKLMEMLANEFPSIDVKSNSVEVDPFKFI